LGDYLLDFMIKKLLTPYFILKVKTFVELNHCAGTETAMCWATELALLLQKEITMKKSEIIKWLIGRVLCAGDTGRVSLDAMFQAHHYRLRTRVKGLKWGFESPAPHIFLRGLNVDKANCI
jgi:hypothetical protein